MSRKTLSGLLALSRWKEFLGFVIPLTLLGSLLGTQEGNLGLDFKVIVVLIGNLLAVAYAFMLNDIEDAADDSLDPKKKLRNPVSSKRVSKTLAYRACFLTALLTLIFYSLAGLWVLWIGLATLLLSHFYSWKKVRLKAWPVVDIVSHSLMLSGLLILSGYYAYETSPGVVWFVIAGAILFSVYGQLYNQLRDFKVDKRAGLKNTAIMVGQDNTQMLLYISLLLGVICLAFATYKGVFPVWIGLIAIASGILTKKYRAKTDIGGTAAIDVTATFQLQAELVVNATVLSWLAVEVIKQLF